MDRRCLVTRSLSYLWSGFMLYIWFSCLLLFVHCSHWFELTPPKVMTARCFRLCALRPRSAHHTDYGRFRWAINMTANEYIHHWHKSPCNSVCMIHTGLRALKTASSLRSGPQASWPLKNAGYIIVRSNTSSLTFTPSLQHWTLSFSLAATADRHHNSLEPLSTRTRR